MRYRFKFIFVASPYTIYTHWDCPMIMELTGVVADSCGVVWVTFLKPERFGFIIVKELAKVTPLPLGGSITLWKGFILWIKKSATSLNGEIQFRLALDISGPSVGCNWKVLTQSKEESSVYFPNIYLVRDAFNRVRRIQSQSSRWKLVWYQKKRNHALLILVWGDSYFTTRSRGAVTRSDLKCKSHKPRILSTGTHNRVLT